MRSGTRGSPACLYALGEPVETLRQTVTPTGGNPARTLRSINLVTGRQYHKAGEKQRTGQHTTRQRLIRRIPITEATDR